MVTANVKSFQLAGAELKTCSPGWSACAEARLQECGLPQARAASDSVAFGKPYFSLATIVGGGCSNTRFRSARLAPTWPCRRTLLKLASVRFQREVDCVISAGRVGPRPLSSAILTCCFRPYGSVPVTATSITVDVSRGRWAIRDRNVEIQHITWRHSKVLLGGHVTLSRGNTRMPECHRKLFDWCLAFMG